jgi:hypothetical protein
MSRAMECQHSDQGPSDDEAVEEIEQEEEMEDEDSDDSHQLIKLDFSWARRRVFEISRKWYVFEISCKTICFRNCSVFSSVIYCRF